MILHDEYGKPMVLNNLTDSLRSNLIWCLDLKAQDYRLHNVKVVEECHCNTVSLKINGRLLNLPVYWYILVGDPETTQLDAVQASVLSNSTFYAVVYGATSPAPEFLPINVVDWESSEPHVYPTHTRGIMLCHDVGDSKWISCSFSDTFPRFLKNKTVGDLIS
jgi:hypothetical protein